MKIKSTLCGVGIFGVGIWVLAAADPTWWSDRVVLNGTPSNNSPANIGQVKNMASHLHAELEEQLPGGAGFALDEVFPPPPNPIDQAWYDEQKGVANIGQLKAVAQPFYERLHSLAPDWVAEQIALNEPTMVNWPFPFPWDPDIDLDGNYKLVNLGQLKFVFSLRIQDDRDGDSFPDLLEHVLYGDASSSDPSRDYDGDGLTDVVELASGSTTDVDNADTDGDGILDGVDTQPNTPATYSSLSVTTLVVLTPWED